MGFQSDGVSFDEDFIWSRLRGWAFFGDDRDAFLLQDGGSVLAWARRVVSDLVSNLVDDRRHDDWSMTGISSERSGKGLKENNLMRCQMIVSRLRKAVVFVPL